MEIKEKNMKTNKTFICCFIILASALFVFSCDVPLALGNRLDIEGPLVELISPAPRTAVKVQFDIEGRVSDESPIKELLIKASLNNEDFPKQWRYARGRSWEVSEDRGLSWQPFDGAVWDGSEKRADWTIPIDMSIGGNDPDDGEYLFMVQAWDSGNFTDDNSYKTRVLILDRDPPKVSVSNPYLYNRHAIYNPATESFNDAELQDLHAIDDDGIERKDPARIGKFITQEFPLQWQIEDSFDVWSIDLRLYTPDVQIDGEPGTPIPDNYIFSYHQNTPPGPENPPDPLLAINPNGNITVPALEGAPGSYDGGYLKTPITGKTTVRVVAVCYDSAGNPNQEKTLGFFVYWPKADWPWIALSDGMEEPGYYTDLLESNGAQYGNSLKTLLEMEAFMIYPGRTVKATAFHAHGLTKVEYSLYLYNEETGVTSPAAMDDYNNILDENPQRPNGSYSTVFPWEFTPPPRTGYYVVKAKSYSVHKSSEEHVALFRVQDISFPNFPIEPSPSATEPLFKFIGRPEKEGVPDNVPDNHIRISGIVSDATEIVSLSMVWINPESRNYAAMSQLQYFRDSSYAGWAEARKLAKGGTNTEQPQDNNNPEYPGQRYPYDPTRPNRLWNLAFSDEGLDIDTGRRLYTYSIPVDLDDLNIGIGKQPLSSQVFLLRAENPDGKCTIITYAPQGDTLAPKIFINEVRVSRTGADDVVCIPGVYQQIPKFSAENNIVTVITVTGEWTEDSTGYLDVKDYLNTNMEFSINGFVIRDTITALGINVTKTPANGNATSGTFKIEAEVRAAGSALTAGNMKDTLAVNASIRDIGGNPSEAGASWLIENDNLRFLRISSLNEDTAYRDGGEIEIFLEFNKPVTLKNPGSNPVLTLNTIGGEPGRAYYRTEPPQNNESTRHFFTYTVAAGQNTTGNLNVDGLSINGGNSALVEEDTAWQSNGYPFTWVYTGMLGDTEEIRITRTSAHDGREKITDYDFYARALPVTTTQSAGDYPFTLIGGKRITVDNQAPTIQSFSASPRNWHGAGADIYITATFSEMVQLGDTTPYLILDTGNNGTTSTDIDDIRVNNKQITFRYTVKNGDNTGTNYLRVTDFRGDILDIPGTAMAADGMSGADGTLTGVYLDTTAPATPTVAVSSGTIASPGAQITGTNNNALGNLYDKDIFIQITAVETGAQNLGRIEYSLNGGDNWTSSTSTPINIPLVNKGLYTVQVRQTDQAGNVSSILTNPVTFNWDPGNLISRISSTSANGTYTNVAGRNLIIITVTFRKPLTFTAGTPAITINARTANLTNPTITTTATATTLSFSYTVVNGDATPTSGDTQVLDVTNISGFPTVTDGGANVAVRYLDGILPASDANALLKENKQIKVVTGTLSRDSLSFINETGDGIQEDGSYWTTLQIQFNRNVSKGDGNIIIEQIAGTGNTMYRLPAVLTEAQYNRFRSVANFDTYYTKGTNGYIDGQGSDTTAKYVLRYSIVPSTAPTGDLAAFATAFREAEGVSLSVNSAAVTISGNTLKVKLSGSNAPQVPGATYNVSYPAGFVEDDLGNPIAVANNVTASLDGVAKPFVRVRKTQDTISVAATPGASQPRLVATQPYQTAARIDSRTPGSTIFYKANGAATNVTATNWSVESAPNDATGTTASRPGDPTNTTNDPARTQYNDGNEITVGDALTNNNYQGYMWWIRATARTDDTYSRETEEVAYRTAITYRLRYGDNAITAGAAESIMANGDQIWIRGGDAIGSSSIPGFPLTWEDSWSSLSSKRAGIRLMTKVNNTTNTGGNNANELNNSTWKFVTWEINATAYVDFIRGNDTESDANIAWQYGPKSSFYQRAGWTSFKDRYPVYPGKHRWCDAGLLEGSASAKGQINFSGTPLVRDTYANNNPNPWTGVNTATAGN